MIITGNIPSPDTARGIPQGVPHGVSPVRTRAVLPLTDALVGLALASLILAAAWGGVRDAVECVTGLTMLETEAVSLLLVVGITAIVLQLVRHAVRRLGLDRFTLEERRLLHRLRAALRQGEVEAHFQPIRDAGSGVLVGAEALARWRRDGALVPPAAFIPLAERAGLIREMTRHIARLSIIALGHWTALGFDLTVSVNISAEDLESPDLPNWLHGLCAAHGVPPSRLCVELTETQSILDIAGTAAAVARLRDWGMGVHLDDFGTGYASMSVLQRIPFTGIKIDREFVARAREDATSASIVRASTGIARDLGLRLVAEGVEDADTEAWLLGIGVRHQQGFHFARPMPPDDFIAFVSAGEPSPTAVAGRRADRVP